MKTAILKIAFLAIGFVLIVPASVAADDASDEFRLGIGLYRQARYQLAADTFSDFLKAYSTHPNSGLARLYLGLSLNEVGDYEDAHRELSRFLKENPESSNIADARFRIGESSFYAGDYRQAISELTTFLDQHGTHKLASWGKLFLAESHSRTKDYETCERQLKELLASTTSPEIVPEARFELAKAIEFQQREQEAIAAFQKLADDKLGMFSSRSLARIGTIYFGKGEFEKASASFDRIVSEFSRQEIAISAALQSAVAQYSLNRFSEAIERLKSIPDDHSRSHEARQLRGICLRQLGQLDDARNELKAAFVAAGNTPRAAEILFQRAELERLDNKKEIAGQMFLDLADRWPKSSEAPDAILNAAESKMELRQLPQAKTLLARLRKDYPDYKDSSLIQLLSGRMLLIDGKSAEAVDVLRQASQGPNLSDSQRLLCHYHLIRALHRNEQFADVIDTFEKLEDRFGEAGSKGTAQAISLAAVSYLELKRYPEAEELAAKYLSNETTDTRRVDALATRAVACARQEKYPDAKIWIDELLDKHHEHPQTWRAVLLSAESAWSVKDYAAASSFYVLASGYENDKQVQESGMAGQAWSRLEMDDYDSALTAFRKLVREFPKSPHISESRYMTALCAERAGNAEEAAETFESLFTALESGVTADNSIPDARWAFDAGIAYSRLQAKRNNGDLADRMYARVTSAFAGKPDIATTFDEWAASQYKVGNYKRSDEINQQIVDRFPQSEFAPNARLSLAESDMVAGRLEAALAAFRLLDADKTYPEQVREISLTNMIDILAAGRQWPEVLELANRFDATFPNSPSAPQIDLFQAEGLLNTSDYDAASMLVDQLRAGIQDGSVKAEKWADRVWILAAEIALAEKRYNDIDEIETEFLQRNDQSRFGFQLNMVQGLRWKNQPVPDFARSREYLTRVTKDEISQGTKTAAKCQFLIAETYLLEQDTKTALREYLRVYINYAYDDWRAPALFQAALCEEELGDKKAARKSLLDVVNQFPDTAMAARAQARLDEMTDGQ